MDNSYRYRPSPLKDFFLSYPPIETLEEYTKDVIQILRDYTLHELGTMGYPPGRRGASSTTTTKRIVDYKIAREFSTTNKARQRAILRSELGGNFPTPNTYEIPGELREGNYSSFSSFIVRPLFHSQGKHWKLTKDPSDFIQGSEYIQEVYPKDYEYRILCVRGEPLVTLLKKVPEDMPKDQPWNHSNGSYFTILHDLDRCRLNRTDVFDRIRQSSLLKCLDLSGIDVMYRSEDKSYMVAEVNLCPSLQIPESLETIANFIRTNS